MCNLILLLLGVFSLFFNFLFMYLACELAILPFTYMDVNGSGVPSCCLATAALCRQAGWLAAATLGKQAGWQAAAAWTLLGRAIVH
jgi:hypothetical protein